MDRRRAEKICQKSRHRRRILIILYSVSSISQSTGIYLYVQGSSVGRDWAFCVRLRDAVVVRNHAFGKGGDKVGRVTAGVV